MEDDDNMKLITVHLPEAYLNGIDRLVSNDAYPNRSEAIRVAVRDLLKNELGGFVKYEVKEVPDLIS
jgi:Arc/MetJ-type ribon-helix-helix transcriptional regulator